MGSPAPACRQQPRCLSPGLTSLEVIMDRDCDVCVHKDVDWDDLPCAECTDEDNKFEAVVVRDK